MKIVLIGTVSSSIFGFRKLLLQSLVSSGHEVHILTTDLTPEMEGVPRSTQEAMAVGRPIITTDVPGCRETIRDGENGFKVPPHNPQALAEAMEKFVAHSDLILRMGRRSRELAAQNFDAEKVNKRLIEFLEL